VISLFRREIKMLRGGGEGNDIYIFRREIHFPSGAGITFGHA
jgi:hypothetical protein